MQFPSLLRLDTRIKLSFSELLPDGKSPDTKAVLGPITVTEINVKDANGNAVDASRFGTLTPLDATDDELHTSADAENIGITATVHAECDVTWPADESGPAITRHATAEGTGTLSDAPGAGDTFHMEATLLP